MNIAASAAHLGYGAGAGALLMAMAWLYFDYITLVSEERFEAAEGYERGGVARNSYVYLHPPMAAGIIFVALGLEEAVAHVTEPLGLSSRCSLWRRCALPLGAQCLPAK